RGVPAHEPASGQADVVNPNAGPSALLLVEGLERIVKPAHRLLGPVRALRVADDVARVREEPLWLAEAAAIGKADRLGPGGGGIREYHDLLAHLQHAADLLVPEAHLTRVHLVAIGDVSQRFAVPHHVDQARTLLGEPQRVADADPVGPDLRIPSE